MGGWGPPRGLWALPPPLPWLLLLAMLAMLVVEGCWLKWALGEFPGGLFSEGWVEALLANGEGAGDPSLHDDDDTDMC